MKTLDVTPVTELFFLGIDPKKIKQSEFDTKVSSAILSNFDFIVFDLASNIKEDLYRVAERLLVEAKSNYQSGFFEIDLKSFEKFEYQVKSLSIPRKFPKIDKKVRLNKTSVEFPSLIKDRIKNDDFIRVKIKYDLAETFKELTSYFSVRYPNKSQYNMSVFLEELLHHNPYIFECLGKRGFNDYKDFFRQISRIINKEGGHFLLE